MINKNLQNSREDESLSVGDEKIHQMLGELKRIDAPKDFDFRLKARIANARPADFQPRFLPVLRYVLPFSAIVLVLTFVIINGGYFTGNSQSARASQPIPAESKPLIPESNSQTKLPETTTVAAASTPNITPANISQPEIQIKKRESLPVKDTNFFAYKSSKKSQNELPKGKIVDEGGGSRVSAVSPPPVFTPNGIPSTELVVPASNNDNKNDIITKQILLPLGIEIVSENGNRRVKTVKKDSIGERSSVKVGDLIQAIDGEKVSGDAVRTKPLAGKQITVLRGTEKIEINFNK